MWIILGLLFLATTSLLGLAVVSAALIRLPADYFSKSRLINTRVDAHPVIRWSVLIFKNVAGGGIILFGLILALPGVPGPGILIALLGLMIMDFPGKRRLELWLVNRPAILTGLNRVRQKFGKAPFVT